MFEFNGVSIKGDDDLREALSIETSAYEFEWQVKAMIERWGVDSVVGSLSRVLCGRKCDFTDIQEPLIKFTHKRVPKGPKNDPWEWYETVKIEE